MSVACFRFDFYRFLLINFVFNSLPKDCRKNDWIEAISPHANEPFTGMICSHHFYETDFYKNSKANSLKKNSIPKKFDEIYEVNGTNGTNCTNRDECDVQEVHEENAENVFAVFADAVDTVQAQAAHAEAAESLNVETDEIDETGENGEKSPWYQHYLNEKAERNVEEQKLRNRIKLLENKVQEKKRRSSFWNRSYDEK